MKRLLQVSLLLNVALLAVAGWRSRSQAPAPARERPEIRERESAVPSVNRAVSGAPEKALPWMKVESADPAQFIANLRASGCPEETCREVVAWRVFRQFRQRLIEVEVEALRSQSQTQKPGSDPRWERAQNLRNEMISTIESLSGESFTSPYNYNRTADWTDTLSLEKRRQLRELDTRHNLTVTRLQDNGHRRPEILAQIQELERQKQSELANILSPQELEEYLYRKSTAAAYVLRKCPEARSEAEFRAMVKLAAELGMTHASLALVGTQEDTGITVTPAFIILRRPGSAGGGVRNTDVPAAPAYQEQKAAFQQRLKEVLSEERLAELAEVQAAARARAEMDDVAQVASVASSFGISNESSRQFVERARELHPVLTAKIAEMEKNLTGSPEEKRKQMVTALKAEYEKLAVEIMGEKGLHVSRIIFGLAGQ